MPLSETYPRGVLFVGIERPNKYGEVERKLAGTSFLVRIGGLPGPSGPQIWHGYAITAKHVVDSGFPTFVRMPIQGGKVRDEDVPEWIRNPTHDVAVAPLKAPDDHDMVATDLTSFVDDPHWHKREELERWWQPVGFQLQLGAAVYFVGLLGKIAAMEERNIPIVRSGTIGRLWQNNLPVRRTPHDAVEYITAHLIDCRSFGGFSGAPCYAQETTIHAPENAIYYRDGLLGLIGGHFDDWALTRARDDPEGLNEGGISDNLEAPVSTGVGYVIPAEFIRETLMQEELVEMRREVEERIVDRHAEGGPDG